MTGFLGENDTRTGMRQFTHTRECEMDNAARCFTTTCVPSDRPCSAFREQIGEHRAGTRLLRRGGIEEGTRAASAAVEEKKQRKKKKQKRLKALFRSLRLSPRSPAFFSVPPHFILVHHAVPSTSPKPPQTHRPVLRCAPLLAALHIAYHSLAFCPLYYVFGHYNQGKKKRDEKKGERRRAQNANVHARIHESRWSKDQVAL